MFISHPGSFFVTGDDIYLVWEGDIKILKINRKTKGITFKEYEILNES